MSTQTTTPWLQRSLDAIERAGNKLPDPAVLFALFMLAVWLISWALSGVQFSEIDPRTGKPIVIVDLLDGAAFTTFMSKMVSTFVSFPPLGVVLVAMLGLGVAEHTGFINAGLRSILNVTPKMLLTPVLIAVGILSHVAVDAGYVLVIPLGAVIFYAAGRHPLAGIAAAFAGVSGGFSASLFVPSSLDPMLAGLTQAAARLSAHPSAADMLINPLNNFFFTTASAGLIILVGWFLTDKVIEPRLKNTQVDGDPAKALAAAQIDELLLREEVDHVLDDAGPRQAQLLGHLGARDGALVVEEAQGDVRQHADLEAGVLDRLRLGRRDVEQPRVLEVERVGPPVALLDGELTGRRGVAIDDQIAGDDRLGLVPRAANGHGPGDSSSSVSHERRRQSVPDCRRRGGRP